MEKYLREQQGALYDSVVLILYAKMAHELSKLLYLTEFKADSLYTILCYFKTSTEVIRVLFGLCGTFR
jgi:hypothetical protein